MKSYCFSHSMKVEDSMLVSFRHFNSTFEKAVKKMEKEKRSLCSFSKS